VDSPASHLVKDQVLPPGQDYHWLRRTGLSFLEQLCNTSWTDYNEHDPGVTLLEALCYLLTEVGSRAALPIPTLLATGHHSPNLRFGPTRHALLTPPPATLADYEQLVLTKLPRLVKSIAITPVATAGQAGRYHVRVEPCPPPLAGLALDTDRLGAEVLHLLNQHRNLGEVFGEVQVLKLRPVAVSGHLALGAGQPAGPALTSLLLELGHQLPQRAGGPHPPAGQVPMYRHAPATLATALPAGHVAQQAATQLKYASQTAGLHTLHGLMLHPLDNPADVLADDEVPLLDPAQTLAYLTVTQQGLLVSFDYDEVLRTYYAQVRFAEARADALPHSQPPPLAGHRAAHDSGSVQDLLPPLYGVGENGPSPTAPDRAAIMQFKGYMLLFDQLLANAHAQLANVGAYFSPAAMPAASFHGLLYEVPYVAPLLPGTGGSGPGSHILPDDAWRGTPAAVQHWQAYQRDPDNAYVQALEELAATSAPVASGREDFLKHLLARFGYAAMPVPTAHGTSPEAGRQLATQTYEHLLHHLEAATCHRASARLPAQADEPTERRAESGLEFMLYLLTGLEPLARKWAHHGLLTELEVQLRPGEGAPPGDAPHLVVRGSPTDFAQVVEALADELLALESALGAAPTPWRLELTGVASTGHVRQEHLWHLAARLERFCLLDHAVLRPLDGSATDQAAPFYQQQATVLLPGYAPRFRPWGPHRARHDAHNRQLVERFISQFAPAHLCVHVLWLDYPAMRDWEQLYEALARASGLLNPKGRDHAHILPEAQHRAQHFLERHLRHATPSL
jgi:hypothetical protein